MTNEHHWTLGIQKTEFPAVTAFKELQMILLPYTIPLILSKNSKCNANLNVNYCPNLFLKYANLWRKKF
jgi:hypothetical protein